MGIVALARDVRLGDIVYLRDGNSSQLEGKHVERIEVGSVMIRLWVGGYTTALVHPYEVVGVERAD